MPSSHSTVVTASMYTVETSYYPYLGLLLLLCSSCAALAQFLRPTDLKWSLGTRRLAMPPGPLGVPVLGNLPQMMRARRGALSFNKWVSLEPFLARQQNARLGTKRAGSWRP